MHEHKERAASTYVYNSLECTQAHVPPEHSSFSEILCHSLLPTSSSSSWPFFAHNIVGGGWCMDCGACGMRNKQKSTRIEVPLSHSSFSGMFYHSLLQRSSFPRSLHVTQWAKSAWVCGMIIKKQRSARTRTSESLFFSWDSVSFFAFDFVFFFVTFLCIR